MRKLFIAVVILTFGLGWFLWYEHRHSSSIPNAWFTKSVTITGTVATDPQRGIESTKIIVRPDDVFLVHEKLLVTLPSAIDVAFGDHVSFSGIVKRPESFITETNRIFDYPRYLSVKNIGGTLRIFSLDVLSRNNGSPLFQGIITLRSHLLDTLKKMYTRNQAGLLAGIMLGEQSLLPKNVVTSFQKSGLTHIMVLSGHNITLVAQSVVSVGALLGMGYRLRRMGTLVVIPLFLFMTGLGASSVRAGIMAMIMIGLQMATRPAHALRIIGGMIAVLWIINPRIILYDPSFHLSLLAFLGLIYAVPFVVEKFNNYPMVTESFFGKLLLETAVVQIVVLPYILWMSGEVSLFILLANVLVVPVISLIMGIGFISMVVGFFLFPMAFIFKAPVQLMLDYVLLVANKIGSIAQGVITMPPFSGWLVVLVYTVFILVFIFFTRRK